MSDIGALLAVGGNRKRASRGAGQGQAAFLRATVTVGGALYGSDCSVLIDGASTPITAKGIGSYLPNVNDRVLVTKVGAQMQLVGQVNATHSPPQSTGVQGTGLLQGGTVIGSINGLTAQGTITFPTPYAVAPNAVLVSLQTGSNRLLSVNVDSGVKQTTTGFTYNLYSTNGTTSITASPNINWLAFG